MPPEPNHFNDDEVAGIVVSVLGTALLIAVIVFIFQRRREQRLQARIEKAATFTFAAQRTKSIGTEDEESSEPPHSARSELNPYHHRTGPALATTKSSSRVELFRTRRQAEFRNAPHELEAGVVTMPPRAKLDTRDFGDGESEAGSPVTEMKEAKV